MSIGWRASAGWALCAIVLAASATSCAAAGAKVPLAPGERLLADRIEALEADIAQLHAEMQELRIAHLPLDEMTEEEFSRHLEKSLARSTPEAREALEKTLRGRRGAARLSEEGASRYWEERFETEKMDDPWGKKADDHCRPITEKSLPQGAKLIAFECKNERCRVEIDFPTEQSMPADVDKLCLLAPGGAELFAGALTTRRVTSSKGRVKTVVFVVRKGYSLAPE